MFFLGNAVHSIYLGLKASSLQFTLKRSKNFDLSIYLSIYLYIYIYIYIAVINVAKYKHLRSLDEGYMGSLEVWNCQNKKTCKFMSTKILQALP